MGSYQYICCFYRSIGAKLLFKSSSDLCIGCKNEIVPDERHVFGRNWWYWKDLLYIALPAFVCGIQPIGNYIKQTKSSVLEVLNEEYIKTARSKGLRNVVIVIKHAFRNSLIPIVTTLSLSVPFLIGGAVVTEQIFAGRGSEA